MPAPLDQVATKPRRFLIVQLKRIGDVILTTPMISAIKSAFPDAVVDLAIDANAAGIAPAIDASRVLIRRSGRPGFWFQLPRSRYDVVFDVTGNDRSALTTALCRAPLRATFSRFSRRPLRRWIYTTFVESSVRERHTIEHHLDMLSLLRIHPPQTPTALMIPDHAFQEADRVIAEAGIQESPIVIHPGTTRAEKFWTVDGWAEVLQWIASSGRGPIVISGSHDLTEKAHIAAIQERVSAKATDLSGRLSLLGTCALIARARMLVSVDSAPIHIADAVQTPVVALYGPTNPFHWHPRSTPATIVTPKSAGPIHPRYPGGAMSEISAEEVIGAIQSGGKKLVVGDPP